MPSLFSGLSGVGPIGDIGSILGGGSSGGKKLYGTKPTVPDLESETQKAIAASLNIMPSLTRLADSYNTMSQDAMNKQFESAVPGFSDYIDTLRKTNESLLAGKFPDTVQKAMEDQVNRTGAAWNFAHGTQTGSFGIGRIGFERGQIPLQAFNAGLSTEGQWTQIARQRLAPSLNTSAFLISPQQQFQRDWQQSLINAAPDPVARGQFDTGMQVLGMVLSAYGGGPGYTGTYKPPTQQPPPAPPPQPSPYYPGTGPDFAPYGTGSGFDQFGNPVSTAPSWSGGGSGPQLQKFF